MILRGLSRARRLNTLDLAGDGDETDLIEDVARAFGVRFERHDFDSVYNLGDFERVLQGRMGAASPPRADLWDRLAAIALEHAQPPLPLDRNTTLFARYAREMEDDG